MTDHTDHPTWASGSNWPGCLPESDPTNGTWDEARLALQEDLLLLADDALTSVPPDTDTSEAAQRAASALDDLAEGEAWFDQVDSRSFWLECLG